MAAMRAADMAAREQAAADPAAREQSAIAIVKTEAVSTADVQLNEFHQGDEHTCAHLRIASSNCSSGGLRELPDRDMMSELLKNTPFLEPDELQFMHGRGYQGPLGTSTHLGFQSETSR